MAGYWQDGSFLDNFAAAADALGHENLGAAWGLAGIQWESRDDREQFLNALTKVPWNEMRDGAPDA
jgi:hypothetical protein